MSKPLTYKKPTGEWGIEGVDLSALPPQVYGALCKLKDLEHPYIVTRADLLRHGTVREMAEMLAPTGCGSGVTGCPCDFDGTADCVRCWESWLQSYGEVRRA